MKTLHHALFLAGFLVSPGSRAGAQTVNLTATDNAIAETFPGQAANPGNIRVTRSGSTASALTVWVKISGIALQNSDYRFAGTIGSFVVIPAGSAQLNIPITPTDDWQLEGAETLRFELDDETASGTPTPYTIGDNDRLDLVITDNESAAIPPPAIVTVSVLDGGGWETPHSTDPAVFVVSRTNDPTSAIDVAFTLGGTATGDSDYTVPPLTVTIPAGAASANVVIPVLDDLLIEPAETVTLTVTPHPNTVMPPPPGTYVLGTVTGATVHVFSEDVPPPPTVTLTSPVHGESHTLPARTPHSIKVNFTASDTNGYIANYKVYDGTRLVTNQNVTYPGAPAPGTPYSGTATIPDTYGGVHPIRVVVTDNSGLVVASATASVTVTYIYPVMTVATLDNDAAEVAAGLPQDAAVFSITVDTAMPIEQYVLYRLTSPGPAIDFALPAGYSLANWPMSIFAGPTDYGWAVFPPGVTQVDIVVVPVDDMHLEGDETLTMEISYPFVIDERTFEGIVQFTEGGFHADPNAIPVRNFQYDLGPVRTATATIHDNDTVPAPFSIVTLTAADSEAQETAPCEAPNPGAFRITRDGPTAPPLTVNFAITTPPRPTHITSQVASAGNGVDYIAIGSSATIPAGASSVDVVIAPIYDLLSEPNEVVQITLRPPGVPLPDPASYMFGAGITASLVIRDATLPAGTPIVRISASDSQGFESAAPSRSAAFAIYRTGDMTNPLTVSYTIGGTANNGVDYDTLPASVTIPTGAASVSIVVNPIDDPYQDDMESVSLTLHTPPLDVQPPAYALAATSTTQRSAGVTIRDIYVAPLNRFQRALRLRFPGRYAVVPRPQDPLAPPPPANLVGWKVEASANLMNWEQIGTVDTTEEVDEFVDLEAADHGQRFYRFVPILTPPAP